MFISPHWCPNAELPGQRLFGLCLAPEYGFLDKRLFIPEKWFGEDYAERRKKCWLSAEISFKTKPQSVAEMLEKIVGAEEIPFRYVAADSIYRSSQEFLEAVEKVPGVTHLVALPRDTLCWLQDRPTVEKHYRHGGEKRTKRILAKTEKKPVTFEKIVRGMNDCFMKKFEAIELIDLVYWIKMKNHQAYLSHRKRKLVALRWQIVYICRALILL